MKTKKEIETLLKTKSYDGHRMPTSRRDFLKWGVGGITTLSSINLAQILFASQGFAQTKANIPTLIFDLAGGAALPGNFLVGMKGGAEDLCADYSKLGWNPRSGIDKTYGLPMASNVSQILAGLNQAIPAEYRKNLKFGSYLNFSRDDTGENILSALGVLTRAQSGGALLKSGASNRGSESGGNSRTTMLDDLYRPVFAQNFGIFDNLGKVSIEKSELQKILSYLKEKNSGLDTNYGSTMDALTNLATNGSSAFDPLKRQEVATIYGLNGNQNTGAFLEAAIVMNTILGNIGASVITIPDCDYHNNTRQTGDAKDLQIGLSMGRAVAVAARMNKPLFIQVITDGGLYGNDQRQWIGDSATRSMMVLGYYNPQGNTQIIRDQVGAYQSIGEVDMNTLVGNNPENLMRGVLANYLNVQGRLSEIGKILNLGNDDKTKKTIEQMLLFA